MRNEWKKEVNLHCKFYFPVRWQISSLFANETEITMN